MASFLYCIAARLALVTVAWSKRAPAWFYDLAFVVGLGFLMVWRKRMVAFESTAAGNRVWWDDLRPFHAAMWLSFSVYREWDKAWSILAADLTVGTLAWALRTSHGSPSSSRRA